MTDLETIAAALERLPSGGAAVLCTLMRVEGSAYRGPGARMLVLPDDTTVGAVSGGCLEKDLVAHAAKVRAAGVAAAVAYDLTAGDDAPWGLNMGCRARLDVLLEPLAAGAHPPWLVAALAAEHAREPLVVATVLADAGGTARPGARLMVLGIDRVSGALGGRAGDALRVDALRVMREERSDAVEHDLPGGRLTAFVEYVAPPVQVLACGDGHDATELVRLGAALGWHTRQVRQGDAPAPLDERTAVVVMTHNYARDRELLASLLRSPARYIAVLGPKARTAQLLGAIRASGAAPNPAQLLRLASPAGLDIGAETPVEVALAILAEVRAVLANRAGGRLRDRSGPIHDRR
jgi:xanthine/CO dehydrogenase XdhC/CoxF family maturation factor